MSSRGVPDKPVGPRPAVPNPPVPGGFRPSRITPRPVAGGQPGSNPSPTDPPVGDVPDTTSTHALTSAMFDVDLSEHYRAYFERKRREAEAAAAAVLPKPPRVPSGLFAAVLARGGSTRFTVGPSRLVVLHDPTSPTLYKFAMDVPPGGRTVVHRDGSATVYDRLSRPVAVVARPWAYDASGREQKTWYTVDPYGDLIQEIAPSREAWYPIIADPAVLRTPPPVPDPVPQTPPPAPDVQEIQPEPAPAPTPEPPPAVITPPDDTYIAPSPSPSPSPGGDAGNGPRAAVGPGAGVGQGQGVGQGPGDARFTPVDNGHSQPQALNPGSEQDTSVGGAVLGAIAGVLIALVAGLLYGIGWLTAGILKGLGVIDDPRFVNPRFGA